jgi:hypothetical protein
VYNEFSSGGQDLTALRDFATKLNTPSGTLKYILILGDTTFDFRNKTTSNKNLSLVTKVISVKILKRLLLQMIILR